jgi:hypothetical protein
METNETRKGKYNKISLKIEKIKFINIEKKPYLKKMRCLFFLQTSNLHPNKKIYKSEKIK